MGSDAVPKCLDPGGQSLQAAGDPAGGVGLEGRPQGPAHRPADGRAHRPAGDEPDDEGQGHRAQGGLPVGRVEPLHHRRSPHGGTGPEARHDESDAHPDAGAKKHDDRGHRPNPWMGAS